jgi:hypothetical protein
MSSTTGRRILATWATGVTALGLLVAPAPVHAAPACGEYGFAGPVTIEGNGAIIELNFSADGRSAGGPATGLGDKGNALKGTISGGVIGNGPGINLTFTPEGVGGGMVFNGAIREDDLIATGTQTGGTWSTAGPLACLDEAEAAPKDGTAKVTGDVDMYDAPGGVGNKYDGWLEGGEGQRVPLITCNDENWCNVIAPNFGPDGKAVWVWGGFIER